MKNDKKNKQTPPAPAPEKKERNAALTQALWGSLLQIVIGAVLLVCPDFGAPIISVVVGWGLIAAGAIGVVVCVVGWPVLKLTPALLGIAGLGLGIYFLIYHTALAKIFGIFAGVYLVVQGVSTLVESRRLCKAKLHFVTELVLGLLMTGLGIGLLFFPLTGMRLVVQLFGGGMVVFGVVNLVIRVWAARKLSQPKSDPNIVDADQ